LYRLAALSEKCGLVPQEYLKISAQSDDFGFLRFVSKQNLKGTRRILFIGWIF
jgi:hypothetical protein